MGTRKNIEREHVFAFVLNASGEVAEAAYFHESYLKDRARRLLLRRLMRRMLEDFLFDGIVALGIRVEDLRLSAFASSTFRHDWVREVSDAYDQLARGRRVDEAVRFSTEFARLQQRFGVPETLTIPFFGNGDGGLSHHLRPLFEEIGRRLRCQLAQSEYLRRQRRLSRTRLALECVEAHVTLDVSVGRITAQEYRAFCAARDVHQGLRSLLPKKELAALDREIRARLMAQGIEPFSLIVTDRGRPRLSEDGVFVFEELLARALRRPTFLPSLAEAIPQAA